MIEKQGTYSNQALDQSLLIRLDSPTEATN